MDKLEKIQKLLSNYNSPQGGSAGGEVYQNYPWPILDELPARFRTTKQKLLLMSGVFGGPTRWAGVKVLDIGCANGALDIGLALWGAKVTGVDQSEVEIGIAQEAAKIMGVHIDFRVGDVIAREKFDVIICMSVWKWVAYQKGLPTANIMLQNHSTCCNTYIFESGISDAGTDLGVNIRHTQIPFLLAEHTFFHDIELLGTLVDPKYTIRREVWKVW